MSGQIGTAEQPLRVAIIGSGPSGFYAAEGLQREALVVQVDMYDRLPTPFGLVRGGVAPDHQKIKSVTRVYDKIAAHPEFRFYGNVEFGRDVTHADLLAYYHAIVYAVGARTDRRLGVPGEHLPGSHSATEFVGWYNAHPDHRSLSFRLAAARAVVVGNGNVAMDLARILASSPEVLAKTDIADYALAELGSSGIREIVVLGPPRAGPGRLHHQGAARAGRAAGGRRGGRPGRGRARRAEPRGGGRAAPSARATPTSRSCAASPPARPPARPRRIVLRFLASPVRILGAERVEGLEIERNELYRAEDDSLRPRATEARETIACNLVFRAIGYQGVALAGVPFDAWAGRIPNQGGRVLDPGRGEPIAGEYAVGWIKRGPQGIIGTNKPDSQETVAALLADLAAGRLDKPDVPGRGVLESLLRERKRDYVSYEDWQLIDQLERERGEVSGAPRLKFSRVEEMLHALGERKEREPPSAG